MDQLYQRSLESKERDSSESIPKLLWELFSFYFYYLICEFNDFYILLLYYYLTVILLMRFIMVIGEYDLYKGGKLELEGIWLEA